MSHVRVVSPIEVLLKDADPWICSSIENIVAENDIALFLLKGFSASEIANLRGASEKTVKQQCTAIYAKSGVAGRAELSAFFLEEVLGSK